MFPPLRGSYPRATNGRADWSKSAFDVLLAGSAALALFMIAFAEQIIVLTAGSEFEDGAIALQLLALRRARTPTGFSGRS